GLAHLRSWQTAHTIRLPQLHHERSRRFSTPFSGIISPFVRLRTKTTTMRLEQSGRVFDMNRRLTKSLEQMWAGGVCLRFERDGPPASLSSSLRHQNIYGC